MRRATTRARGLLFHRVCLLEQLETRRLLAVVFSPAAPSVPALNRPDIPTGMNSGNTETAIAVNPTDPGNIALSNQGALLVSNDAGGSFLGPLAYGPLIAGTTVAGVGGDPDVTFDSQGRLFWTNLANGGTPPRTIAIAEIDPTTATQEPGTNTALVPFNITDNYDKQFLAADYDPAGTSPFADRIYTAFTELSGTDRVQLSRSTDNGQTFSALVPISSLAETNAGGTPPVWPADVSVAPNGDVYVAYQYQSGVTATTAADGRSNSDGTTGQIFVLRSTDGGVTFPQKTVAFGAGAADIGQNVQTAPNPTPNTRFWMAGARQPWVLGDPARPGNVYVVTNDDPDNSHGSGDDGDVVFSRSTDNGMTWSTSTVVAGPNNSHQFFPTAAIDRFGTIVMAWYDNRRGLADPVSGDWLFDVRASYSTDGGLTWANSFMVSDPANPLTPVTPGTNTRFTGTAAAGDETFRMGEYFGIANYGGTAHVVWNGNTFTGGGVPNGHQAWLDAFPVRGSLTVIGDSAAGDNIEIRDISGNADFFEVMVNGQRQYAGLKAAVSSIGFALGDGNDTLFIRDTPDNIPVIIVGGAGNDIFIIGDGDLESVNGTYQVTGDAGHDELYLFDGNDAGADTYTIVNGTFDKTGFSSMTFATLESFNLVANGAGNIINVFDLPNGTELLVNAGSGDDQINIGNGDLDNEILGAVIAVGGPGNDLVRLFDQSDTGNDSYVITETTVTKPGTAFDGLTYDSGVENLVVTANEFNNIISIAGTSPQMSLLTINARGGNDTINVSDGNLNADIDGSLSINGGAGSDTINLDDEFGLGDHAYIITAAAFTKTGFGLLTFAEAELLALTANLDNNSIELRSTSAGTDVSVNGGQASDTIIVGNGDFDSNILSDVVIAGGEGNDTIIIDDESDDSGPDAYFIESTTFHKFNFIGTFTYGTTENLLVDANTFDNNIAVNSVANGVAVTVTGHAGDDDFFIGNGDIDTNILGNVFVHGAFGEDRLFLNDNLDNVGTDTYTLTPTTFDKTSYAGLLTYTFIQAITLNANAFNNMIHINGTETDVTVTVNGNGGADSLFVNGALGGDVVYHGGAPNSAPGDTLHVTGTPASLGQLVPDAAVTGDGVVTVDGRLITFTGLDGASPHVFADAFDTFRYITPNSMDRLTVSGELPAQRNIIGGLSDATTLANLSFANIKNLVLDTGLNDFRAADDMISIQSAGMVAEGLFEFRLVGGVGQDTLNVNFGTFTFRRDAFPDTANLTINIATGANVIFEQTQHLAGLHLSNSADAVATTHGNHVIVTGTLSIGGLGVLDLNDNDLIVDYSAVSPVGIWTGSAYDGVTGYVQSGRIVSSVASVPLTTIGVAEARHALNIIGTETGTFTGETVDATSVLAKFTWGGDANLDGTVNIDDYGRIDSNVAQSGSVWGWFNGDFNYDGKINIDDYGIIDAGVAAQGLPL